VKRYAMILDLTTGYGSPQHLTPKLGTDSFIRLDGLLSFVSCKEKCLEIMERRGAVGIAIFRGELNHTEKTAEWVCVANGYESFLTEPIKH
jgi:hypothetical protein